MAIYLDHNASSPLHPEVLDAMLPFMREGAVNASSLHSAGRYARSAIETARGQVAALINCPVEAVIFTSCGSESNNFLLKGFTDYEDSRPIVSSQIEHPSVIEPLNQLAEIGQTIIRLKPDGNGQIDLSEAKSTLATQEPKLLSVMLANSETGVLQPIKALTDMVNRKDCLTHSDATQVVGKLPVDMKALGLDALTFSGHKLRGPQGVGVLASIKKPKQALISGGAQEKYRRAGTENVAMIVGLGQAARLAALEIEKKNHHLMQLQQLLETRLSAIPGVVVFGQDAERLPNTTFFSIPYYHGETLLMELDKAGFALASGSACHSAVTQPSHVLEAMGVDEQLALNAIRASTGMENRLQDVDALANKLEELVNKLPAIFRQAAG